MKIVIATVFLLFSCNFLYAQRCDTATFQSRYWIENGAAQYITKLVPTADGNMFITGGLNGLQEYYPDIGDACITKITGKGTVLWAKKIGYAGSFDWPYDAKGTADGGLVLSGVTQSQGNPRGDAWLVKLDASGGIEWSYVFSAPAGILRKVIVLSDGGFAAVGEMPLSFDNSSSSITTSTSFMVRVDKNGELIWYKTYTVNKDLNYANAIKQLKDGNLLVFGGGHRNFLTAPYDGIGFIAKLDIDNGAVIWSNEMQEEYDPGLDETANGDIHVTWRNFIHHFNADGNNILNVQFELPDNFFDDKEVLHLNQQTEGENYYVIKKAGNPILIKVTNDSAVVWAHSYHYQSSPGYMIELDDALFANNAFYLGAAINMNYFPDSIYKSSDLPFVIKTDEKGNTPCSDTFATPFTFIKMPLLADKPVAFHESVQSKQFPAGMYSLYVVPHSIIECAAITCCRDTVQYKNVTLCEGTHYTLPGGNTISEAGIYPSNLKTYKGCDSVIFTTVKAQANIKASLGNDTCLTHDYGIKYKLSLPGTVQYEWQDGATDSFYTAKQPGLYWVRASTFCNTSVDSVVIYKDCDFPVYVPGAFTPNKDGRNDIFRILNLRGQQLRSFIIYNRFGQRIFATSSPVNGWDGTINGVPQQPGTYIYIIRYNDLGGYARELKGTVVLIR